CVAVGESAGGAVPYPRGDADWRFRSVLSGTARAVAADPVPAQTADRRGVSRLGASLRGAGKSGSALPSALVGPVCCQPSPHDLLDRGRMGGPIARFGDVGSGPEAPAERLSYVPGQSAKDYYRRRLIGRQRAHFGQHYFPWHAG